jgi:protein-S-isoprenylcysteine O-methyltransferase Ste14
MPLVAGLLVTLFAGVAEFFMRYVTKKVAFAAAAVATFAALTLAMWGLFTAALVGVAMSFPGGSAVTTGVWLMVPDNGPACLSAIFAMDTAAYLYRWNVENLKLASWVT